jgi:hypothetical protein
MDPFTQPTNITYITTMRRSHLKQANPVDPFQRQPVWNMPTSKATQPGSPYNLTPGPVDPFAPGNGTTNPIAVPKAPPGVSGSKAYWDFVRQGQPTAPASPAPVEPLPVKKPGLLGSIAGLNPVGRFGHGVRALGQLLQ